LPAREWGAQERAAWQRWPCCAGLWGMLPAKVRARSQLPVGTDGIHGPQGGRGLFAGAAVALGCERVPALSLCKGPHGLAWGKELGSAVGVHGTPLPT